jgi:hypothetical protein
VGDEVGIDWQLAASTIAGSHPGQRNETGLDALLDILSTPKIFTRTLELIASIPERVVNPGLRILEVTASQTIFLAALSKRIQEMLNPDAMNSRTEFTELHDATRALRTVSSTAVPGGRLATARDRSVAEAADFDETAEALGTLSALYGADRAGARAHAIAIRTGTELREYRTAVQVLVATPVAERAGRLHDWGVHPAIGQAAEPDTIAATVAASLEAGESLPLISLRLRDHERELRARTDFSVSEQIKELCPRTLEDRFIDPGPMAGPQPWLIAIGAVAVTVAAQGRVLGVVAGLATALVWLGLLGLTVARGPGGRLADHRGSLIASAIAAAVGFSAGVTLARVLGPPDVVGEAGVAVGLGAVLVATTLSWQARTGRWRDRLQVEDVVQAIEGLTSVVLTAANRAWSAEDALQDALIRARSALDGAVSALRAFQQKIDRDLAHDPVQFGVRTEFDAFVGRGLALLVLEALKPVLSSLKSSSPQEHQEEARRQVALLLAEWDQHVDNHGALDPPEFAIGYDMHDGALGDADVAAISAAIAAEPRDVMWQLCRAGDLGLLDAGVNQVAAVRFAPQAAQSHTSSTLPVPTEWITSTRQAGVLRLIPLRRGVVHRAWSTEDSHVEESLVQHPPTGSHLVNGEGMP